MGIVEAELLSILIVAVILFDRGKLSQKRKKFSLIGFSGILAVYLLFLVVSVLAHSTNNYLLKLPPILINILFTLHSILLVAFILIWMINLEWDLLSPVFARRLAIVQAMPLAVFVILSILSFYPFFNNDSGAFFQLGSTLLFTYRNALGVLYCAVALVVIGLKWEQIDRRQRLASIATPGLLLVSILLYHLFLKHIIFTISSSFLLLAAHQLSQHRRIEVDPLSGVANYNGYLRHLDTMLRSKAATTLFIIDVENFSYINQHHGNPVGDALLREFAEYLRSTENHPEVFRVGGNRFALSMPLISHNHVVRIVNSICNRTAQGWSFNSVQVTFHVNIGIVEIPLHANSVGQITNVIEFLINELKSRRRQTVLINNQNLVKVRQRRLDVLTVLRKSIVNHDLVKVHCQPIYSATSRRIVAAEALMRIEDSRLGMLLPGEFIPLAESSGLISQLTQIMLKKVCRFIVENSSLFHHVEHISINISAEDFSSTEVTSRLLQIIYDSGVDPHKLCFEMTESVVMSSFEDVRTLWQDFARLGVVFALDDFGTGYANLESLVNIPFDVVKMDRSVVSNATNNYQLVTLIGLVLERLGKLMIAEGVETEEQLGFVQAAGVDRIQGYYFSKPVPQEQFLDLVRFDNAR